MIVSMSPARGRAAWDRSMLLPSPSTPSVRFARDVTSQTKARAWVEAVIGRRLPEGDFAAGFKDGVGLCHLVNVFKPGIIAKVETLASPFHQMANISCFLKACRTLGVREQVLFETLDLFNENRLSQVVRCLFSLSELARTTMPSFKGPYLEAPEKPEVDPAVLHLVDLAKGNIVPAPAWGGSPVTPGAASTASSTCGTNNNSSNGAAVPMVQPLSLPRHEEDEVTSSGRCLSPAARQAGKLTYGIYEGGGVARRPSALVLSPRATRGAGRRIPEEGGVPAPTGVAAVAEDAPAATAARVLEAQLQAEDRLAVGNAGEGGGGRRGGTGVSPRAAAVEYAESSLTVVNTPRAAMPTPRGTPSGDPTSGTWRTSGRPGRREEGGGGGGDGDDDGDAGSSGKTGLGIGGRLSEDQGARKRKEAIAQRDTEMEVALWIEGVTGETFPGKFWSSLKDGVVLSNVLNSITPGLVPNINPSRGTFPELENITAFLSGCRKLGVAEHSLFDPKDLHEKRDMRVVVRCLHVLGATVQTNVPGFNGPFLGKKSEALSIVNARGLRKRLGKGPGARGGIHTLTAAHKGGGAGEHVKHVSSGDIPIEHPDPTATMTPAESPSAKRAPRRRDASDSAAGSGGGPGAFAPTSPRAVAEGLRGALLPSVILEEEAGMTSAVVRVEREGSRGARVVVEGAEAGGGQRNLSGLFAEAAEAATPRRGGGPGARVLRRGASGSQSRSGAAARVSRPQHQQHHEAEDDGGEDVVSQIQRFIELHTRQPWRINGNMYESLRDGWQLALLANALRPGAVRRVHNSIQPAKQVQNIAHFLIACRRMGVARVLLFDIEDLYENKSETKVARTLLALRALAADPDFARARPSSLMGTSLLVTAAASAAAAGLAPGARSRASTDLHQ